MYMYMFCPMCKNVGTVSHHARRNMRSPTGYFAFLPLAFLPLLSSPFASFSRGLFTLGFLPPLCFDRPCLDSSGSARDHGGELLDASGGGGSVRRGRGRSLAAGKAMPPEHQRGHPPPWHRRQLPGASDNERTGRGASATLPRARCLLPGANCLWACVGTLGYSPKWLIVDPCSAN